MRAREAEVAERRRATGVCPMLSVVAMGMLLIGRRADRRHGSRGATPTIARPRTPTSTPPPSPDSPRQRAACNLSLPHVSIPRAFTTRTPRQSLLHAFDRVQTHSTRVHLTTESRLPGELSSLSLSLSSHLTRPTLSTTVPPARIEGGTTACDRCLHASKAKQRGRGGYQLSGAPPITRYDGCSRPLTSHVSFPS